PPNLAVGAAARPWHRPGHPRAIRRPAEGRNGLSVPSAAPPRETRLARREMGGQRSKPAREVLPADLGRKGAARARTRPVVAARRRDRTCDEPGGGEQGVARCGPITTTSTTRFAGISR